MIIPDNTNETPNNFQRSTGFVSNAINPKWSNISDIIIVPVINVLTYVAAPILGAIIIAPKTIHAPINPPVKDQKGAFLRLTKSGIEGLKKINIIKKIINEKIKY